MNSKNLELLTLKKMCELCDVAFSPEYLDEEYCSEQCEETARAVLIGDLNDLKVDFAKEDGTFDGKR